VILCNIWQQAGQVGVAGFKLKDSGDRVQSDNVQAIAPNWGIGQANQSSEKCFLAASQAEKQKVNHLKGGYGYGASSCTPLRKPVCLITSLKCLCTNARGIGNK